MIHIYIFNYYYFKYILASNILHTTNNQTVDSGEISVTIQSDQNQTSEHKNGKLLSYIIIILITICNYINIK